MTDEEKAEILESTENLWNERNRLKELEKENEELKKELQDYQFNYDSIKELTKENEQLKAMYDEKWQNEHTGKDRLKNKGVRNDRRRKSNRLCNNRMLP